MGEVPVVPQMLKDDLWLEFCQSRQDVREKKGTKNKSSSSPKQHAQPILVGIVAGCAGANNTVNNFSIISDAHDLLRRNRYPQHLQFTLLAQLFYSKVVLPEPGSMALFQQSLQAPAIGFDTLTRRLMYYKEADYTMVAKDPTLERRVFGPQLSFVDAGLAVCLHNLQTGDVIAGEYSKAHDAVGEMVWLESSTSSIGVATWDRALCATQAAAFWSTRVPVGDALNALNNAPLCKDAPVFQFASFAEKGWVRYHCSSNWCPIQLCVQGEKLLKGIHRTIHVCLETLTVKDPAVAAHVQRVRSEWAARWPVLQQMTTGHRLCFVDVEAVPGWYDDDEDDEDDDEEDEDNDDEDDEDDDAVVRPYYCDARKLDGCPICDDGVDGRCDDCVEQFRLCRCEGRGCTPIEYWPPKGYHRPDY